MGQYLVIIKKVYHIFMEPATQFFFQIAILILSVVIHEVSHGYVALLLGDRTAYYAGRLTLNPLRHIDLFGSILLPIFAFLMSGFIFGWAKPVPYNPYNLRYQKWGPALVGIAGPGANIALAVVFGLVVRFLPGLQGALPGLFLLNFMAVAGSVALLNLVLAVFNLVPIPPLDGSKVLFAVLPYQWRSLEFFLERYGFFLLLLFIFFFSGVIGPVVITLFRLLTGTFPI